jgi:cytochrome b
MPVGNEKLSEHSEETRKVWDLPVRIFHWSLAVAFLGAFVTNRMGVQYFPYHVLCGYAVIVLVAFRIIWGVIGTRHARFWNFVRGPVETLRYAVAVCRGRERTYPGHNPLGALMVVILLAALGVQSVVGLFANDEIFNFGPLYGYVSDALSLQLTTLHRRLFYWISAAVGLHVAAILFHRLFRGERLVKAMITGRKPPHLVPAHDAIHGSRAWLAVLVVVLLAGVLTWVVNVAPNAIASN